MICGGALLSGHGHAGPFSELKQAFQPFYSDLLTSEIIETAREKGDPASYLLTAFIDQRARSLKKSAVNSQSSQRVRKTGKGIRFAQTTSRCMI